MPKTKLKPAKSKQFTQAEIFKIASLYCITDLPEQNRTHVMKVGNPIGWSVVHFDLADYAGRTVTIKFSAEVMRVGAAGTLRWQINNKNYPSIGQAIYGAKQNIWHRTSGEWTGVLSGSPPCIYLNTWRNDSERTTFYIDKINIEITSDM
ncbi:MAG: hypothetical protein FWH20_07520 [Oscillospiraceae bacterium]|nr:hypothetical protein [Oscillospiraceae bacterium]